jgi:indole-3-glycerol phosphate synthase/phosphoribosylanthranilate isomerase/anthranilate synthase/indole-3-glycerol phosphate synthase/phosphoribosylanthranilate isomerase
MANDFLDRILAHKIEEIELARRRIPEAALRDQAVNKGPRRLFFQRLAATGPNGINIIAEIKRASPSKGPIRLDLDPAALAQAYEAGGAACLSVLTDEAFFKGSLDDLRLAREATSLPVLRKDFILSTYQIHESAAAGADAVLLIARTLSADQLIEFQELCRQLGLDALVEVYSKEDLALAKRCGAQLIGINNRNLGTFETDIGHALELKSLAGADQVVVAASGISGPKDIHANLAGGIYNFLIGESLVRAPDPSAFLLDLIRIGNFPQVKMCGLTRVDEALACADVGAAAIGLVFYPKSPRFVSEDTARQITKALPSSVASVGVFVDEDFESIMRTVNACRLSAVQLHGTEPPLLVDRLRRENITVIKALFATRKPFISDSGQYSASAYLTECGQGTLPGGNARAWEWQAAKALHCTGPLILAGGLDPGNVASAIANCLPDAVDVSSGIESAPGRKDHKKAAAFMQAVRTAVKRQTEPLIPRRIF